VGHVTRLVAAGRVSLTSTSLAGHTVSSHFTPEHMLIASPHSTPEHLLIARPHFAPYRLLIASADNMSHLRAWIDCYRRQQSRVPVDRVVRLVGLHTRTM